MTRWVAALPSCLFPTQHISEGWSVLKHTTFAINFEHSFIPPEMTSVRLRLGQTWFTTEAPCLEQLQIWER